MLSCELLFKTSKEVVHIISFEAISKRSTSKSFHEPSVKKNKDRLQWRIYIALLESIKRIYGLFTLHGTGTREWDQHNRRQWVRFLSLSQCSVKSRHNIYRNPLILVPSPVSVPVPVPCSVTAPLFMYTYENFSPNILQILDAWVPWFNGVFQSRVVDVSVDGCCCFSEHITI